MLRPTELRPSQIDGGGLSAADQASIDAAQSQSVPPDVAGYILPLTINERDASTSALPIGDEVWTSLKRIYFTRNDYSVAGAGLPELPAFALPKLEWLYVYLSASTAKSMGTNDITDVPLTWRNGVNISRINMQRNQLTSAQQVKIVGEIEREILAGMSSAETSTGTLLRIIDFRSTASLPNLGLVQADLAAFGWTITSTDEMTKTINGFVWTVRHNEV